MQRTISVPEEIEGIARALEALGAWQARTGPAGPISGWSGDQHLFHIALATDLALTNVTALVAASSPRIVHGEVPNELALRVLEQGSYPRGESTAPRMVQPPDEVDAQLLREEYVGLETMLEKVRGLAAEIPGAEGAIRHQQLGALSAEQWLRFARLHGEHHLAIVRDIAHG